MATFPLLNPSLCTLLQEQIVKKLNYRNYFRLQQTCKDIDLLVRTNRNIRVCMKIALKIDCAVRKTGGFELCLKSMNILVLGESLYGIRISQVTLEINGKRGAFKYFYDTLKHYRITCSELKMRDVKLSQEQCEEMFDILKPIKVCLTSANGPDLFEALFHSKTLKSVKISFIKLDGALDKVQRLLCSSNFEEVRVSVAWRSDSPTTDTTIFKLLVSILEILHYSPLPNMHFFHIIGKFAHMVLPPIGRLLEQLAAFHPVVQKKEEEKYLFFKCTCGHSEANCELTYTVNYIRLRYTKSV